MTGEKIIFKEFNNGGKAGIGGRWVARLPRMIQLRFPEYPLTEMRL
jgi:hypothetical protein